VRNLGLFIFFSILLHLTSLTGLSLYAPNTFGNHVADVTEIDFIEDSDLEKIAPAEKPVVKQLDSDNSLNADNEARFSSEKTQRVKVETKASQIGESRNQSTSQGEKQKPPVESDGEVPEFARAVSSNPNHVNPSQIGYDLPSDIRFSDTTNLNTDANIYYSFYDRIDQLVRVRWVERLDYYWNRISFEFKKENLVGRIWSTTFEITLKESGEYYKAVILRSSGYKPFDEAAIYAFKNARYFPNVPRAKVESDGMVRLKYRFSVHVGP